MDHSGWTLILLKVEVVEIIAGVQMEMFGQVRNSEDVGKRMLKVETRKQEENQRGRSWRKQEDAEEVRWRQMILYGAPYRQQKDKGTPGTI